MYNFVHHKRGPEMHRTQIYLQDALHENLKARARSAQVSLSELIRRTLEKDLHKNPSEDARAYFERLKPLKSFAEVDANEYVKGIRDKSRILRGTLGSSSQT